jgi:uncharacterized protein
MFHPHGTGYAGRDGHALPTGTTRGSVQFATPQRTTLREVRHRPYELPSRPWVGGQTWEHLLFAHWRVEPSALAAIVPTGLELDVFDGWAWIAITPFLLRGLRLRFLPSIPGVNPFLETNVRTYVRRGGRGGIYFFSLDATSRLAVDGARILNGLPYRHARGRIAVTHGAVDYRLRRTDRDHEAAWLEASYRPQGPAGVAPPGSLEQFLVERYCLFTVRGSGEILRTDIHHRPWRIHPAAGEVRHGGLVPAALDPLTERPLLHVARRQDVVVWRPVRA